MPRLIALPALPLHCPEHITDLATLDLPAMLCPALFPLRFAHPSAGRQVQAQRRIAPQVQPTPTSHCATVTTNHFLSVSRPTGALARIASPRAAIPARHLGTSPPPPTVHPRSSCARRQSAMLAPHRLPHALFRFLHTVAQLQFCHCQSLSQ